MTIHYSDDRVTLHHGDCLDVLRSLPDASVDSVVCDPPYGLEFMGKDWDRFAPRDRKNATVWDGRRTDEGDWKQAAAERSGKGGGGPSYRSQHKGAKRCTLCGRRAFSGSPCECPEPQWVVEHRQEAPSSMLAFQAWCTEWTRECYRVLKPGGHLLAFGGTRTWHRLACAVEDAGFEVRDSIAWLYGSGFPKSLDVSKAIDKARVEDRGPMLAVRAWLNAQRLAAGVTLGQINAAFGLATNGGGNASNWTTHPTNIEVPSWEKWEVLRSLIGFGPDMDAEVWRLNGRKGTPGEAWGQREVIGERTTGIGTGKGAVAYIADSENRDVTAPATDAAREWAGWGTALKPAFEPVVVARKPLVGTVAGNVTTHGTGALNIDATRIGDDAGWSYPNGAGGNGFHGGVGRAADGSRTEPVASTKGRWPANVILDSEMADVLDEQSGTRPGMTTQRDLTTTESAYFGADKHPGLREGYNDSGGASRFFYVAKAPKRERPVVDGVAHPTVKPLALMRWLVRLVTPPGGTVLEPFAGSGTTVEACIVEGFQCIAVEKGDEYLPLILARIRRQTEPPEVEHLTRRTDPEAAIVEQVREMSLFELDGEGA